MIEDYGRHVKKKRRRHKMLWCAGGAGRPAAPVGGFDRIHAGIGADGAADAGPGGERLVEAGPPAGRRGAFPGETR